MFADFKMLSAHDSSIRRGSSADGRHEQLLLLKWSFLLSFAMKSPKGLCAESTNILCTGKCGSNKTMLPPNETFYSFSESSYDSSIGPCVMFTTAPSNMCQKGCPSIRHLHRWFFCGFEAHIPRKPTLHCAVACCTTFSR